MKLKQRRIKTGLKVDTILKYLNISRTTYYFMEIEKRKLTVEEEEKLNKLFEGIEQAKAN